MAKAPKFSPHFNKELGKRYYTAKDYYSDMKKAGLEPYNPNSVAKKEPKKYERSAWANSMLQDIRNRNGAKPGDRFVQELVNRGYTQERAQEARRLANER